MQKFEHGIIKNQDYFLRKWGFSSESSSALKAHAIYCAQFDGTRIEDIISGMNLAAKELVEKELKQKPANVLELDYLIDKVPSIRENYLKIVATHRQIPFVPHLDPKYTTVMQNIETSARLKLDKLNAVYAETPDGNPLVLFSDVPNMLAFMQEGSLEREEDPIRKEITKSGHELIIGLAPVSLVNKMSKDGDSDVIKTVSNTSQDNFWSSSQAKTDAERLLARILDEALNKKATDISFDPLRDGTSAIRVRVFGDMSVLDRTQLLSPDQSKEILNFLISRSRAGDGGRLRKPADGQMTYKNSQAEAFIRTSFIPADKAGLDFDMISASLRLMPKSARSISLDNLNLNSIVADEVKKALIKTQGLIVLAGPTNSGKSTTIAGIVGQHVQMFGKSKKRLSLEEPVERYLEGITQISVDGNFAELIRALLRHDPDLVWVGEIRDSFSAGACVRASTSGHVVLSTVHANDSILAFRAISNYLKKDTGEISGGGASIFDLAESLSLIISQRLVKRLCPHCRKKKQIIKDDWLLYENYLKSENQLHLLQKAKDSLSEGAFFANPNGCSKCYKLGYIGELPINEVLPASRAVKDLFSKSDSKLNYSELSSQRLNTLTQSALELVAKGEIEFSSLFV